MFMFNMNTQLDRGTLLSDNGVISHLVHDEINEEFPKWNPPLARVRFPDGNINEEIFCTPNH